MFRLLNALRNLELQVNATLATNGRNSPLIGHRTGRTLAADPAGAPPATVGLGHLADEADVELRRILVAEAGFEPTTFG